MKFKARKNDLLRELQLTQGIVDKKHTIPILSNLLVQSHTDDISIIATDTEITMKNRCPAEILEEGQMTIPARKAFEIVRNLPEADVEIELQENFWLQLKCANSQFRICGLDPADFPKVPEVPEAAMYVLDPARFKELLQAVLISTPVDETRFPISGALFSLTKKATTMVSTDGHRLSVFDIPEKRKGPKEDLTVIIARKTLMEMRRMLDMEIKEVQCAVEGTNVIFLVDKRTLISNTIQKKFPDYKGVFPEVSDKQVKLGRNELEKAIRRVAVLSSEKSRSVKLAFSTNSLTLSAGTPEMGEAKEELPVEFDCELEVCFNYQYILDFLGVAGTDQINLRLKDGQTQGVFEPLGVEGYSFKHVVMPMRV
jgi:DNA polymerase-3 subunit beta